MKNLIFPLIIIFCVSALHYCKSSSQGKIWGDTDTTHTSRTSADWDGSYRGVLPCADCEGLETTVILGKDLNYTVTTKYLGKTDSVYERSGKFSWSERRNIIRLDGSTEQASTYFVGENVLTQLDKDGNKITGELAEKYILRKSNNDIVEKYWKLIELHGKPLVVDSTYIKQPHIIFKKQENKIIGHGGCNSITGTYELKEGNRIIISNVISTRMACPTINVELEFLNVLAMADNYNLSGDMLVLNKARTAPLARFKAVYLK